VPQRKKEIRAVGEVITEQHHQKIAWRGYDLQEKKVQQDYPCEV